MADVYLPVVRVECCRLVINVARLAVVAVDGRYVIVTTYNPLLTTVDVVEIYAHEAVAVARHEDMVGADGYGCHHLFLDILADLVLQEHLADGRAGVDGVEREHVLVAVHGIDNHLLRVTGALDARYISVLIERYLHLLRFLGLDVEAPYRHLCVVLACLGVLVAVVAGIDLVFVLGGFHAAEHLQGVCLYVALVELRPEEHCAVGIELKS